MQYYGTELLSHSLKEPTTKNLSSLIDLHTHASSTFDNHVTLTFDLVTPESTDAERLTIRYVYSLPSWVLIARVIFLLERGQTHTQD